MRMAAEPLGSGYRAAPCDERRFLEMDDGVRIALTLHFPDTPPPWPVVFEARPYRKDDLSDATSIYRRLCDEGNLAVCRADVRGTGSSEGDAVDEYTARELQDHVATIAWLAEQEWSNGNVGMYGTSYSGFNSLQVAALRPPALKAIIPIYATDRRYTDDVHYGGGARRGIDFLDYPAYMVALIALPPVPSVYGEGWREEWHRRIEANDPWELGWLEHQNEDDYWRHGSVFFDYAAIEAATLVIAGHADGYRNMAFRAFERLRGSEEGPVRTVEPHEPAAVDAGSADRPRPGDDRLVEAMARRRREHIDVGPPISIFVRRWTDPAPDVDTSAGEWRAEPDWPPARLAEDHRRLGSAAAPSSRDGGRADGRGCPRHPRRRRRHGVDLVRRDAPLRSAVGPAAGRGVLPRLRLARHGGDRDHGPPPGRAHRRRVGPCGLRVGEAL